MHIFLKVLLRHFNQEVQTLAWPLQRFYFFIHFLMDLLIGVIVLLMCQFYPTFSFWTDALSFGSRIHIYSSWSTRSFNRSQKMSLLYIITEAPSLGLFCPKDTVPEVLRFCKPNLCCYFLLKDKCPFCCPGNPSND